MSYVAYASATDDRRRQQTPAAITMCRRAINNVTNLYQLTSQSTQCRTTWRSYRDHRSPWRRLTRLIYLVKLVKCLILFPLPDFNPVNINFHDGAERRSRMDSLRTACISMKICATIIAASTTMSTQMMACSVGLPLSSRRAVRPRHLYTYSGVFPFRRMPHKLLFPLFSFLVPFINAIQPFYGCQRNARKNITVTVSVRVSVTVRVSLVWRHRHFLFRKISKWHGFSANWDSAKWGITGTGPAKPVDLISRARPASDTLKGHGRSKIIKNNKLFN